MSTTSASPTPTTSPDVPFTPQPNPGQGNGTSSSLYLFTFLATLLLLLCVSSAIILRSFILRRRFRRRVEQAILSGAYNPTDFTNFSDRSARRRRDFGARPAMHDIYAAAALPATAWKEVYPVAAVPLPPDPEKASDAQSESPAPSPEPPRRPGVLARLNPFARRTPLPDEALDDPPASVPAPPSPDAMQVTLLIAMPDLRRHAKSVLGADEDEPLPEMVLGTAAVPFRDRP
ncbi:hypothetical protein K488DRAFT_89002 [Vararia minispora EC-137]|uniref:Uncharacterized protein n=1 Tax=Vararia minispora EC-137 TaxID=1314806 RepID=A0ACB8QBE6_9AGAM|nr:hypothetical protein K488DRAFT_89002 [Vararia minispora EC-137]